MARPQAGYVSLDGRNRQPWSTIGGLGGTPAGPGVEFELVDDRSLELLTTLFASSPDAVVVVDEAGCIEMASAAAERLFGYRIDELVGTQVEILVPDSVKGAHLDHRARFVKAPVSRPMGAGLELEGRRRNGTTFPVDVSLAPVSLGSRQGTAAFVRDATDRRRSEYLMRYVNEVTQRMLAGEDTTEVLTLVGERARTLVGASAAWVVMPDTAGPVLRVVAATGRGAHEIVGATLDPSTSLSAQAMAGGRTVVVDDMRAEPSVLSEARNRGFGPGAYFPMLTQDGPIGALVVARDPHAEPFNSVESAAAEVFASAAAVGIALGGARDTLEAMHLVTEHERIARDLHDTVIQRLFALGMGLQGAQRLASGAVGERISQSVQAIDEVIREIRETIFDLNRPPGADLDVRQRVREAAGEVGGQVGLTPRTTFRGPVEAAVSDEMISHLLAVLREALTNVGRHARASTVDVVVAATADTVTLSVADDGIGPSSGPSAGHGLANMADRAAQLGGELTVSSRRPRGTLLVWTVPTGGPTGR